MHVFHWNKSRKYYKIYKLQIYVAAFDTLHGMFCAMLLLLLLLLVFMLHALFRDYTDSDGCCVTVVAVAATFIVRHSTNKWNQIKNRLKFCFWDFCSNFPFFVCRVFSCRRKIRSRWTRKETLKDEPSIFCTKLLYVYTNTNIYETAWAYVLGCLTIFHGIDMCTSCGSFVSRSSIEMNMWYVCVPHANPFCCRKKPAHM